MLSLERYTEALNHLNQVIKIDPAYKSNLYLLLSITHKKMARLDLAF